MKTIIALLLVLLISCGGGGADPPSGPHVAEQTDYYDGVTFHRYFRYDSGKVGYATSTDGLRFDRYVGNPIMDGLFPILVQDGDNVYLIVKQGNDYNLFDTAVKTKPAFVRTVLTGGFFNVGVAVVGDRWHMLVEGKAGETFHLRYTWADFSDLNFNTNLGPVVFNDAGNPYLTYIPERDAILALYGADYRATGLWRVRAAIMPLGESWQVKGFILAKAGVHMADPDLGVGIEPSPLILTVGSSQDAVSSYTFKGSRADLYDAIAAGHVELEDLGVTMRP